MPEHSNTVFVLGAGFTKAFVPDAPLLTYDFDFKPLLRKFEKFPSALRVLELERDVPPKGHINLERLMTRLDGLMPYDFLQGTSAEMGLVNQAVIEDFIGRFEKAEMPEGNKAVLGQLAEFIVERNITCITFNYDDVFDEALWNKRKLPARVQTGDPGPFWHPDDGYGFLCSSWYRALQPSYSVTVGSSMRLLKLHGSLNWRTKLGARSPFSLDSIVHSEPWLKPQSGSPLDTLEVKLLNSHLNPRPLIVPPVLTKASLIAEPVLQRTWSCAYETLKQAKKVLFVGYSFPVTDLAARFLFKETLDRKHQPQVSVVNYAQNAKDEERVVYNYKDALSFMNEKQFDFGGALEWSQKLVATS